MCLGGKLESTTDCTYIHTRYERVTLQTKQSTHAITTRTCGSVDECGVCVDVGVDVYAGEG